LEQSPALKFSGVATTAWLQRLVKLAERFGASAAEPVDDDRAAIIAGAYLGGIDAMMFRWAAGGGTESVVVATERVHRYLRPLLL
jgi:hypothetical protein